MRVPGDGPTPARVLICGEAPGFKESEIGKPFVGPSGQELTRYLKSAGINRSDCYITNLVKLQPPFTGKQQPPSPADIERDAAELLEELARVQPEIICAVGAFATRAFLGADTEMPLMHGLPHKIADRDVTFLSAYHPAAGMHKSEEQIKIYTDFQQLGKLVRGEIGYVPVVPFDGQSIELTDASNGPEQLLGILAGYTIIGCDTEGVPEDPECVTLCVVPGKRWYIAADQPETLAALHAHLNAPGGVCELRLHYAVHDIPVLRAMGVVPGPEVVLRDTMVDAYVLGTEPQGLKPLSYRRLHRLMREYEEVIYDAEQRTAINYLQCIWQTKLCTTCWGSGKVRGIGKKGQPLTTERKCLSCVDGAQLLPTDARLVWKAGELKISKPWSLSRSIREKLFKVDVAAVPDDADDDGGDDDSTDTAEESEAARKTWALRNWWGKRPDKTPAAFDAVIAEFGPMPRTRLSDVGDPEGVRHYACDDAEGALLIGDYLDPDIEALGLTRRAQIIYGAIPMFERMERTGFRVDKPYLAELQTELEIDLDRILQRLKWLTGDPVNPKSPRTADLLFREMGLPVIKLTAGKGRESIDKKVLETLKRQLEHRDDEPSKHAIAVLDLLLEFSEKNTLLTTFVIPLQRRAGPDDRVHGQITYTRTTTGRPAMKKPNLQNIPARTEWGKRIRQAFVARPGYKLLEADYSQIELVILAHESQDAGLLDTFRTGKDAHIAGAARMFEKPYEKVTKEERYSCKNLNFGVPYGISDIGLQAQYALRGISKTQAECQQMIALYFAAHPGVQAYMGKVHAEAKRWGYVRESIGGGIRWCPGVRSDLSWIREAAEREAGNFPMQGGGASLLEIAMERIWRDLLPLLWGHNIDIEPVVPVHDSLLFECEEGWAEVAAPMIANEMKYAVELSVPVNVGVTITDRWEK